MRVGWVNHLWMQNFLVAQTVKRLVWNAGDPGSIPGLGRSLETEMAAHSSILAWKILWTAEPGRLLSMGLQRVGHNWTTSLHFTAPIGPQASHSPHRHPSPTKNSAKQFTCIPSLNPQEAYSGRCYYHSYFADEETGSEVKWLTWVISGRADFEAKSVHDLSVLLISSS